jgi:hypothetical protein
MGIGSGRFEPALPPHEHGERKVVKVEAFLGESVLVTDGPGLVLDFGEDTELDESPESARENVRRDVEPTLKLIESPGAEEALPDDEPAPPIAGDG